MTMTSQQSMRNTRANRQAQGLCPDCGGKHDRLPKYECSLCAKKKEDRMKKWRAERVYDKELKRYVKKESV